MNTPPTSALGAPADWLEFISESARLGYWRLDLATGATHWSPLCAELLATAAPLDYATFAAALHPTDRARFEHTLHALRAGTARTFDEDLRLAPSAPSDHAGSQRWIQVKGRLRETGGHVHIEGLLLDITARKLAEERSRETERRLHQAAEAARVIFWDMDVRTGYTRCSPNAAAIWGFSEAPGEAYFERVHPDDREQLRPRGKGFGDERAYSREYRVTAIDGTTRWIHSRGDVVCDEHGEPVRMTGVSMDITERKKAEEELRRGEREFRSMFELVAVGTAQADPSGRFTRVNDGLCQFTGYTREELLQKTFWEITHPDDCAPDREGMERVLADHAENWSIEKRYLHRDGSIRWGLLSASIIRDEHGQHLRTVAIVVDITDRKRSEQALLETQARERAYLEHLPVGVWFLDANGTIVYGNATGRQIWSGARYIGAEDFHEYKAWWHGTDRRLAAHEWGAARAIQKGETSLDELLDIECFDGTRKTILNSAVPMRDAQGRVTGVVVINQDVTKLKEAENRVRDSESILRSFYESSPLMMGVVEVPPDNADIIRVYDNPAMERFFGMAPGSTAGLNSKSFAPPADKLDEWIARYRQSERLGRPLTFEYTHPVGDRVVWFSCAVAHLGPGKRGARFSYVAEDITTRKTTELALVEAQSRLREHAAQLERTVAERTAELREINEQLETFVYSVAHDLRAPLRSLTGFSQLLVEDHAKQLDADGKDMLRRIQRSSEFMDKLVLDLLAFGRTARAQIELSPVHVAEAWMAACFQCADEIKRVGARIEVEEPLPRVLAHESTLGQMLANLLSNALKFVAPGVVPFVRIRAEPRGDFTRLWIEDNGTGIAAEQHERVFRVFERLHGSTYPGTGVGLAIVKKGAERLGGRAGVESSLGQGSRFWIDLKPA